MARVTLNTKAVGVTSSDGLNIFSTTLSITPGKDRTYVHYHIPHIYRKPR